MWIDLYMIQFVNTENMFDQYILSSRFSTSISSDIGYKFWISRDSFDCLKSVPSLYNWIPYRMNKIAVENYSNVGSDYNIDSIRISNSNIPIMLQSIMFVIDFLNFYLPPAKYLISLF